MSASDKLRRSSFQREKALDAFRHALEEHNCLEDFQSLVDAGCLPHWLMYSVYAIRLSFQHHATLQNDPARMDSRKLRTLLKKTDWVAGQWTQQLQTPLGKETLKFASRHPILGGKELINTPARLLLLARWAGDIHRKSERGRRPLYDDCLAKLVEYVKDTTGKYHDREVSALVTFAIEQDAYDENRHRVWKSEHRKALERARLRLPQKH